MPVLVAGTICCLQVQGLVLVTASVQVLVRFITGIFYSTIVKIPSVIPISTIPYSPNTFAASIPSNLGVEIYSRFRTIVLLY